MVKEIVKEFFSEARIALMKEAKEHPELLTLLADLKRQGLSDWPDQLACIAAYCYIALEGFYTPQRLDDLSGILVLALKEKRQIIINTGPKIILN